MTVIDWILAEKIAGYLAGTGDAPTPRADLVALAVESEKRVTAYTGLEPARPLPPPEGIGRREWVQTNIKAMRTLLDPVLDRAGEGLGPLKPAAKLVLGVVVTTEVGVAAIPLSAFYARPPLSPQVARFAFCKTDAVLDEAARRLEQTQAHTVGGPS